MEVKSSAALNLSTSPYHAILADHSLMTTRVGGVSFLVQCVERNAQYTSSAV